LTRTDIHFEPIDTSDIDRWIGNPIGGFQLKEPVATTDIRRWVQAMQNPNPLYFDERFATESVFGKMIAPQSFVVACAIAHGVRPAIQGVIPGSHMLFGGDEWSFPGPRINPGDSIRSERVAFDYRVTNTKFAGPTVIQRGDTTYLNDRKEVIARQRSIAIRYLIANAAQVSSAEPVAQEHSWSDQELHGIEAERLEYARGLHDHAALTTTALQMGMRIGRRVIGPHSIQSFTTEWRSYLYTVWGNTSDDGVPETALGRGAVPAMAIRPERSIDPGFGDGLYYGNGRGHTDHKYARLIGMPRPYGFGASMGAYVLDYVANWAGETGHITNSAIQYRNPVLMNDVTYLDGVVAEIGKDGVVTLDVNMTDQDSTLIAKGPVTVQLSC
jgi:acyl dehydratase